MITVLTYQIASICLGCLIVGGVSYGLFQSISMQSSLVNFYYINPVNSCLAAICTGIVVCLLLMAVTFFLFVKTREEISISFSIKRKKRGRTCAKSLAGEEAYKIWRTRKGVLLLLAVLAIQIVQYPGYRSVRRKKSGVFRWECGITFRIWKYDLYGSVWWNILFGLQIVNWGHRKIQFSYVPNLIIIFPVQRILLRLYLQLQISLPVFPVVCHCSQLLSRQSYLRYPYLRLLFRKRRKRRLSAESSCA